jgi:hypothetical protein
MDELMSFEKYMKNRSSCDLQENLLDTNDDTEPKVSVAGTSGMPEETNPLFRPSKTRRGHIVAPSARLFADDQSRD